MTKNQPTLLKVYIIPVLLFNLIVGSLSILTTHGVAGVFITLGYVVIVTVGLYLYLLYLSRYFS